MLARYYDKSTIISLFAEVLEILMNFNFTSEGTISQGKRLQSNKHFDV